MSAAKSPAAAEDVLTASRDLVDFARHRSGLLTGRLTLGVIPSLAPYLLPRILPLLQSRFPELRLELRETQTRQLVEDIKSGTLDAAMLACRWATRHRYDGAVRGPVSAGGAGETIRAHAMAGSPPRTSIRAG